MVFAEGHPRQIEYAVVPDSCWNCSEAKRFVHFLVSPFAQKVLAEKNYMLPVIEGADLGEAYSRLPKLKTLGPEMLEDFVRKQDQLLELWSNLNR